MKLFSALRSLAFATLLGSSVFALGCGSADDVGQGSGDITDVNHTDVERQSIGNCWLYAEASWVESMHLTATGEAFDVSQSYWTYWHWYDQIIDKGGDEIQTGGSYWTANDIVAERGLIPEAKFIKEDATSEMSSRQASALKTMNTELKSGRLATREARNDRALVRQVLDEAWQLTSSMKGQLTKAFGKDGALTFRDSATTKYTSILSADEFEVQYTDRLSNPNSPNVRNTTLDVAMDEWSNASYPTYGSNLSSKQRDFQIRIQRALHDSQPVIITWDVDFNAMESSDPVLRGSFNLTTLKKAGKAGRQGGHMTVLEDYEATTVDFGLLPAGVTLDPNNAEDAEKLDAALNPSTVIKFFRIKNSWGALRDDRAAAPGFPGYHDLYMDYLNGPIAWCPDATDTSKCYGKSTPLSAVVLPPGY